MSNEQSTQTGVKKYLFIGGAIFMVLLLVFLFSSNENEQTTDQTAINTVRQNTPQQEIIEKPETQPESAKEPLLLDYRISEEEDISYVGCKRVALRIVMPDDAKKPDVDFTLKTIGEEYAEAWDSVTIWAWGYSEESIIGESAFTKGMYEKSSKAGCR